MTLKFRYAVNNPVHMELCMIESWQIAIFIDYAQVIVSHFDRHVQLRLKTCKNETTT